MSTPAAALTVREITADDAELLLDWRTLPRITQYCVTDVAYDLDAQRRWLAACLDRDDYYHWMVEVGGVPVGSLNLGDYDRAARTTSWGFCVGDDAYLGRGLGTLMLRYFCNFIFDRLGVDTLNAQCFAANATGIALHRRLGFQFDPRADQDLVKHGAPIRLVGLVLHRRDWEAAGHGAYRTDFPMALWRRRPAS